MTAPNFKQLTKVNWLQRDPVLDRFVVIDPDMSSRQLSPEDWLDEVLNAQLGANVPDEIHRLYEVARGAFAYGYCFYPLCALAMEQLYRVAEAAITHKCQQIGTLASRSDFKGRIDWLKSNNIFDEKQAEQWHRIRGGRNAASHLEDQMIVTPDWAKQTFVILTKEINALFP